MPTPNLLLPFLEAGQAQKHVTHNEALNLLDAVVQLAVGGVFADPPSSPVDGDRVIVGASATGAFAGHEDKVAAFQDGAWVFLVPRPGWRAWNAADGTLRIWNGGAWIEFGRFDPDDVEHLYINGASPGSETKFAARTNAALFDAVAAAGGGTGDVRLQLSKEAAGDTASVFFSRAFSGRAEFGLVESDAFKLKVSADGSAWTESLIVDPATGIPAFPLAAHLVAQSGAPTAPANGLRLFADDTGRQWAKLASGRLVYLGGGVQHRRFGAFTVHNATTVNVFGVGAGVDDGTATAVNVSSTNFFTRQSRLQSVSAAASGANCGRRIATPLYLADSAIACLRFGWETFQPDAAAFVGFKSNTAHGDVDPSSFVNCLGIGIDSSETTWRLLHNDAGGSATKTDLGANFPANTSATDFYELLFWWGAGSGTVHYQLARLNSGHFAQGQIAADLPAPTQILPMCCQANTRSGTAAISLSFSQLTIEVA